MKQYATLFMMLIFSLQVLSCKQEEEHNLALPSSSSNKSNDSISLQRIKKIGDVVYDFPEQFLENQDSALTKVNQITIANGQEAHAYQLLLLNIGYVLRQDGQILNAINIYEKALEIYYKTPDSSIDFAEFYVKPLGSLYTMIGDLQKASDLQFSAISKADLDEENKSALYANLAITIQQLHEYDSAIALSKKGLGLTTVGSLTALRHYNEIASCYLELAKYDSAAAYNLAAINIIHQQTATNTNPDFYVWASTAFATRGQMDYAQNNLQQAAQMISKALALLYQHMPHTYLREKAKLQTMKAKLLLQANNNDAAIVDFHKSSALLNTKNTRLFPDNTITDCYNGLAQAYSNKAAPDSAIQYYLMSIENDYIVQQFISTKESNYFNSSQSRSLLIKATEQIFAQYNQSKVTNKKNHYAFQLLWVTELSKGRQLINEKNRSAEWNSDDSLSVQIIQTQKQLRYLYQTLAFEKDESKKQKITNDIKNLIYKTSLSENIFDKQYSVPNFDTFVASIKEASVNADILSWQINNESASYIITVHDESASISKIDSSLMLKNKIAIFLDKYFYLGPAAFNNDPNTYFETASSILQSLIPQYDAYKKSLWIMSKDGFTYGIPFDALASSKKHFLIEEKSMHAAYSLLELKRKAISIQTSFVNIFANTQHAPGFPDLKHINEEVAAINEEVSTKVYKDKKTDYSTFQQAMNSDNILHISSHAVADTTQTPYLVLEDKISLDKLDFVLTKSPLVVLSACETAKGMTIVGEGVESLNKAFLSKGIKGVIAAQWTINDIFLPLFMRNFYAYLIKDKNPEVALRQAKLQYINKHNKAMLANPWEWASLTYTGEEMQLSVKASSNKLTYYLISVFGVVLILAILFYFRTRARKRKSHH